MLPFRRDFAVSANGAVAAVKTGEKRGTAGRTNACSTIGLHETRAFVGDLIHARRLDQFLPVNSHVALGDIIAEDEDEIWFFGRLICGRF